MKSKKAYWYEVSVKVLRLQEDGSEKSVTEVYCVDAVSFGEAEKRVQKEVAKGVKGGIEVKNINPAPYKEVFFDETGEGGWFKAKLSFITFDDNGREKRSNVTYLVQAEDLKDATKNIDKVMNSGGNNYVMATITETKVLEVFEN